MPGTGAVASVLRVEMMRMNGDTLRRAVWAAWGLYDTRVGSAHHRAGYGTAILAAVERLAREAGALRPGLNVVGDNAAAIALYEANGYEVTTQQMAKRLRWGPWTGAPRILPSGGKCRRWTVVLPARTIAA